MSKKNKQAKAEATPAATETAATAQAATPAPLPFAGQTVNYKSVKLPNGRYECVLEDGSRLQNHKAVQQAYPGATVVWVKNPPRVKKSEQAG